MATAGLFPFLHQKSMYLALSGSASAIGRAGWEDGWRWLREVRIMRVRVCAARRALVVGRKQALLVQVHESVLL